MGFPVRQIFGREANGAVHHHAVFCFQIFHELPRRFFLREDVRRVAVICFRAFHQRFGNQFDCAGTVDFHFESKTKNERSGLLRADNIKITIARQ